MNASNLRCGERKEFAAVLAFAQARNETVAIVAPGPIRGRREPPP
jgi:hypothetical protein